MRTITKDQYPELLEYDDNGKYANPAYMKVGDAVSCVSFPGEDNTLLCMLLVKTGDNTFELEKCRLIGYEGWNNG